MTRDLDKLEALAKTATPGPWDVYGDSNIEGWEIEADYAYTKIVRGNVCKEEDADFIAAANPAVVLELVAELRRQRTTIQRLAKALRVQNRARAVSHRECKHAQDRATRAEQELEEWKQAAVLRWTTSVPNRAGWYWNRVAGKESLPMRLYYDSYGEYCYQVAGLPDECWLVESLADEPGCEWAGPIPEPQEAKQ